MAIGVCRVMPVVRYGSKNVVSYDGSNYKKVFDRLKNFSDENIAYSVMDNAFAEGPYLDKD